MDDGSHKTRLEAACTTSTSTGKKYLHLKNSTYEEMDHFISDGFRDDLRPVLLGLLQENPAYRFPVHKLLENDWLMKEELPEILPHLWRSINVMYIGTPLVPACHLRTDSDLPIMIRLVQSTMFVKKQCLRGAGLV